MWQNSQEAGHLATAQHSCLVFPETQLSNLPYPGMRVSQLFTWETHAQIAGTSKDHGYDAAESITSGECLICMI